MVKQIDESWVLPRSKPITKELLDRAISAEENAALQEHQAQEAWFDRRHNAVMLKLKDGRVFGVEVRHIPSLKNATLKQLSRLRASADGVFLTVDDLDLDLDISVDGLVTRIIEKSPAAIKRSGARLAGQTTSPAKAAASA